MDMIYTMMVGLGAIILGLFFMWGSGWILFPHFFSKKDRETGQCFFLGVIFMLMCWLAHTVTKDLLPFLPP